MTLGEKEWKPSRITVVGCGLVGASLAALLRAQSVAEEIVGTDKSELNLEMARRMGCIDRAESRLSRSVIGSHAIVLALPLDEIFAAMQSLGPDVRPGALITCTAGTTARLHAQLARHVRSAENFVPGFPMLMLQGSGPGAASADRLRGQPCLLASGDHVSEQALEKAEALWSRAGLQPKVLPAEVFEAAVAGHVYWPLTIGLVASKVAARAKWPDGDTALSRWLEAVKTGESDPERSMQLYSSRLCGLLAETIEELSAWHKRLGGAGDGKAPDETEEQG